MKNRPRVPIRSTRGYFRAIEEVDRLYKVRRQLVRSDQVAALGGCLDRGLDFDGGTEVDPTEKLIETLEKRIFAYLDSLSVDKRHELKQSSRKYTHRGLFYEHEDRRDTEYWNRELAGGEARLMRQKERGRAVAQVWSTQLMLDCLPTTARSSEL